LPAKTLAAPHETHLVLSSAANYAAAMDIIEKFSAAKADKLLFTKLDEAVNFGLIFTVASRTGRSLSYLTNGQSVPDDIQPADFRRLALMLMERYR
jgi:flagellar biosynthesis protein FlhF